MRCPVYIFLPKSHELELYPVRTSLFLYTIRRVFMKKVFPIISFIFLLLGYSILFSMSQENVLASVLTFHTAGQPFIIIFMMYSVIAFIFALLSTKNTYKFVLVSANTLLLIATGLLSFIAIFGFQSP